MFKSIFVSLKPWVVFTNARYQFGRELDQVGLADWIKDAFWWQDSDSYWEVAESSQGVKITIPRQLLCLRLRPVFAGFGEDPRCWIEAGIERDECFVFRIRDPRWLERLSELEEPQLMMRFVEDRYAKAIPELMAILPKVIEVEGDKRKES